MTDDARPYIFQCQHCYEHIDMASRISLESLGKGEIDLKHNSIIYSPYYLELRFSSEKMLQRVRLIPGTRICLYSCYALHATHKRVLFSRYSGAVFINDTIVSGKQQRQSECIVKNNIT